MMYFDISVRQVLYFAVCNISAAYMLNLCSEISISTSLIFVSILIMTFKICFIIPTWMYHTNVPNPDVFVYRKENFLSHDKRDVLPRTIHSENVSTIVDEIIKYCVRDYINSWYNTVATDQYAVTLIHELIQDVCCNISNRLSVIDWNRVLSQELPDIVKEHIQKIKQAQKGPNTFEIQHFLVDAKSEEEHLRKIANLFIEYTLKNDIKSCNTAKLLLREIITCKMLKPCFDTLCDSFILNSWMLQFLKRRQQMAAEAKKQNIYADNYENFMKIIDKNRDKDMLIQIRLSIIAEITAASAINSLKRKGEKKVKLGYQPSTKAQQLMNRDLNIYINQLTLCRTHCERRLAELGGSGSYLASMYGPRTSGSRQRGKTHGTPDHPKRKSVVLGFKIIMADEDLRYYFRQYLKTQSCENLLDFWRSVEQMAEMKMSRRYKVARDLFERFVSTPRPVLQFERQEIREMEQFLIGNSGPDSFTAASSRAYDVLESRWYPSFLLSKEYDQLYMYYRRRSSQSQASEKSDVMDDEDFDSTSEADSVSLTEQDSSSSDRDAESLVFYRNHLEALDTKILTKSHALEALEEYEGARADEELLEELRRDKEELSRQRNSLETYLKRMTAWNTHLGSWEAKVYDLHLDSSATVSIIVQLPTDSVSKDLGYSETHGWVTTHAEEDFHSLKTSLLPLAPWLKKSVLPGSVRKRLKRQTSEEVTRLLDKFLQQVISDENLSHAQLVFDFLCPLPDGVIRQQPIDTDTRKKSVPATGWRAGGWGSVGVMRTPETLPDSSFSPPEFRLYEQSSSEVSAEAIFQLVEELFEVHGAFGWLRRAAVSTVRTMYGRTLGRFLTDSVEWLLSENMVVYYLEQLRDSFWPNGGATEWPPAPSEVECRRTAVECRRMLLESLPDAMGFFLGAENARNGVMLLCDSAQNQTLNKCLLYNILDHFLSHLFPELKELAESQEEVVFSL